MSTQVQPIAGRQPPCDLDAEAAVLSACLLSGAAVAEARAILVPEAFYADANRRIFEAVLAEDDATGKVDVTLVASRLRDSGRLEQVGGTVYLGQLIDATPAVAHVEEHARIVAQKARVRGVIATCQRLAAEGYGDVGDPDAWCADAAGEVARAADASATDDTLVLAGEAGPGIWETIQKRAQDPALAPGVRTGFRGLDRRLGGGLRNGCQYCVAGRPGHGKTAFALGCAVNVAGDGFGVVFVSCEMPLEQLVCRAISQIGAIDGGKLEAGDMSRQEWADAALACEKWNALPIAIDDRPAQTSAGIRATVRRAVAKLRKRWPHIKLGLVVVDYIQILRGDRRRGDSREQEVSELSKSLMWLAKELDCPVMTLSQLNRETVKRPGEYRLSDLRESGAIEQDNFGVLFVHRDDADQQDDTKHNGEAQVIVGKLRQGGRIGIEQLHFKGPCTRFYEVADEYSGIADNDPPHWTENN